MTRPFGRLLNRSSKTSRRALRAGKPSDEPHIVGFALLVGFAAAYGDEDPGAVGRIDDIGPAQCAHLAAPHPRHEQQSRDHGIEATALGGHLVGLDAAGPRRRGRWHVARTAARSESPNGGA